MAIPPAQANPDPVARILPDTVAVENNHSGLVPHGPP